MSAGPAGGAVAVAVAGLAAGRRLGRVRGRAGLGGGCGAGCTAAGIPGAWLGAGDLPTRRSGRLAWCQISPRNLGGRTREAVPAAKLWPSRKRFSLIRNGVLC